MSLHQSTVEQFFRSHIDSGIRVQHKRGVTWDFPLILALYSSKDTTIAVLVDYPLAASMGALNSLLPKSVIQKSADACKLPEEVWDNFFAILQRTEELLQQVDSGICLGSVFEYNERPPSVLQQALVQIAEQTTPVELLVSVLGYESGSFAIYIDVPSSLELELQEQQQETTVIHEAKKELKQSKHPIWLYVFMVLVLVVMAIFIQRSSVLNVISANTESSLSDDTYGVRENKKSVYPFEEVLLPPGSVVMGCMEDACALGQEPHSISITYPIYMMRTEVGQELYSKIMKDNPSYGYQCTNNCPVENVNWLQAIQFANALSSKYKLQPCYTIDGDAVEWLHTCTGWRLPTEAEWEYAARGKATDETGENTVQSIDDMAWYTPSTDRNLAADATDEYNTVATYGETIHSSCSKAPNSFNLCDMQGNVWEWVWDWYDEEYFSKTHTAVNPLGPDVGKYKVLKGGSWESSKREVYRYFRGYLFPWAEKGDMKYQIQGQEVVVSIDKGSVGFRLVRTAH